MDASTRAARALQTVTSDPLSVRMRVVEALPKLVDTDVSLFYSWDTVEGVTRIRDWLELGPCTRADTRDHFQETVSSTGLLYSADAIRPFETRTFFEDAVLWEDYEGTDFFQGFMQPRGLRSQIRMLVVHDGIFYGWLGLVRKREAPSMTRHHRRVLAPIAEAARAALVSAGRIEQGREPADLVFSAQGALQHASASAKPWLATSGFRDALASAVRRFDQSDEMPKEHVIGAAKALLTRLDGNGVRYLVHIEAQPPLRIGLAVVLSPTQMRVARCLAADKTVAEVAALMQRSSETVRTHLKEIYLRLNVRTRAELRDKLKGQ